MKVKIKDKTYEIVEATVGDIMPIMNLMQENPQQFQSQLLAKVIHVDGEQLGEIGLSALPLSHYMQLIPKVMEVQGMSDDAGKS